MRMNTDKGIIINGEVQVDPSADISPFVILGFQGDRTEIKERHKSTTTIIGGNVWIGPFVTIYSGARIETGVKIDPYCRIGHNTSVGNKTRILYGARVHDDVVIGENCVIGGNCSNRVQIGNDVVHFGRITHKFNNPKADWNETEEPSLKIGDGSVIGAQALLVGDITIGSNVYIAAGEIVRTSVPDCCIVYKGKVHTQDEWKGSLASTNFWDNCSKMHDK